MEALPVIGTITPSACKPTLTGGGTVDYGSIPISSLKHDALTKLDNKQLDFFITCDAPAKVALKGINGRPNTAVSVTTEYPNGNGLSSDKSLANASYVAGLGLDRDKRVGSYSLTITDVNIDGNSVKTLYQNEDWDKNKWGESSSILANVGRLISWGDSSPSAFTVMSDKLNVKAYINKISELELSKPVKLDGLTTLELVYL